MTAPPNAESRMPNAARYTGGWSLPVSRIPLATCHLLIIAASFALACVLMLVFWPGLATNDSGHRLCLADALLRGASPGQPNPRPGFEPLPDSVYQHVFPPMMSIVAAGLRWLTGTWGVMTLVQCWWFFASLGVLAQRVLGGRIGTLVWMLTLCVPLVWNTALAMLPDAWVTASLCTMLACILVASDSRATHRASTSVLVLAAFAISVVVFFGFRHNSITVLPVLALAGAWLWLGTRAAPAPARRTTRAAILAASAATLGAMLFARALPSFLPWRPADVPATIMVWEHVGALRLAHDDARSARHSLNDVARAAGAADPATATTRAIARHDWVMFNTIVYGPDAPLPARGIRDDGVPTRAAFWKLVREEPLLYTRAKLRIWATVMGLRHAGPVLFITTDEQGPPWTHQYGVHLGLSGPLAHDADLTSTAQPSIPTPSVPARILILAQRLTNATLALWMPYLWFTGSLLALLFAFARPRASHERRAWASLLLFAAATSYYAGFLILSPAFEWRYFLPSFVLLPIVIVAALQAALSPATKSMPPPSRRTIAP
jgi:hypothetical protein